MEIEPVLRINAFARPAPGVSKELQDLKPWLFELHGVLYMGDMYLGKGAQLRPRQHDTFNLTMIANQWHLDFELTPGHVAYLERERLKIPKNPAIELIWRCGAR